MHVRALLLLPAVLAGTALAGCGSAAPSPSSATAAAVTIRNFAFGPATLTVTKGSKVTWTNTDTSVHTVTAVDGSFDSGNLAQGQSFSRSFDMAGTFMYRCNIHQYMTASVVVR